MALEEVIAWGSVVIMTICILWLLVLATLWWPWDL